MLRNNATALLILSAIICLISVANVSGQSEESTEPTTVSNVTDAVLPWNAKRVLPGKMPVEFSELFDKLLAEGKGEMASGPREVLLWEGNYKSKSKAMAIESELRESFSNENWTYETAASQGDIEFFGLRKTESGRVIVGFFVPTENVFVCAFMEIRKRDTVVADTANRAKSGDAPSASIVGKWFRTVGGSTIDWTGKTTLKGGEDFTFEFFTDGTVEYTHKKEILSIMQCRIKSDENARGRYTLNGISLTIELAAMRSVASNSCNAKENYNKNLGNSTITVKIEIRQTESITRPDKPFTMCFDGNEVCYEKQR